MSKQEYIPFPYLKELGMSTDKCLMKNAEKHFVGNQSEDQINPLPAPKSIKLFFFFKIKRQYGAQKSHVNIN